MAHGDVWENKKLDHPWGEGKVDKLSTRYTSSIYLWMSRLPTKLFYYSKSLWGGWWVMSRFCNIAWVRDRGMSQFCTLAQNIPLSSLKPVVTRRSHCTGPSVRNNMKKHEIKCAGVATVCETLGITSLPPLLGLAASIILVTFSGKSHIFLEYPLKIWWFFNSFSTFIFSFCIKVVSQFIPGVSPLLLSCQEKLLDDEIWRWTGWG